VRLLRYTVLFAKKLAIRKVPGITRVSAITDAAVNSALKCPYVDTDDDRGGDP